METDESDASDANYAVYDLNERIAIQNNGNTRKRHGETIYRRRNTRLMSLRRKIEEQDRAMSLISQRRSGNYDTSVMDFEERVEIISPAKREVKTKRKREEKKSKKKHDDLSKKQKGHEEGDVVLPKKTHSATTSKIRSKNPTRRRAEEFMKERPEAKDTANGRTEEVRSSPKACLSSPLAKQKKPNNIHYIKAWDTFQNWVDENRQDEEISEENYLTRKNVDEYFKFLAKNKSISVRQQHRCALKWYATNAHPSSPDGVFTVDSSIVMDVVRMKARPKLKHAAKSNGSSKLRYQQSWIQFCDWIDKTEAVSKTEDGRYLTRENVDKFFLENLQHRLDIAPSRLKMFKTHLQACVSSIETEKCQTETFFEVNSSCVQEAIDKHKKAYIVAKEERDTRKLNVMNFSEERPKRSRAVASYRHEDEDEDDGLFANYQHEGKDECLVVEDSEGESSIRQSPPTVTEIPVKFKCIKDPNEFYVEEEAHLYHNPPIPSEFTEGITHSELDPIPLPQPLPELPNTGKCFWKFDKRQRVLLADFSSSVKSNDEFAIDPRDEEFFLQMLERNDITLVSEGFISAKAMNPEVWKLQHMQNVLGEEYYHKFRRFDTIKDQNGFETYREIGSLFSMKIGDYVSYLAKRSKFLTGTDKDPAFTFIDSEGNPKVIDDIRVSAIYMVDLDINKSLPDMHSNFVECFRYPSVLPGGFHCMMNSVRHYFCLKLATCSLGKLALTKSLFSFILL